MKRLLTAAVATVAAMTALTTPARGAEPERFQPALGDGVAGRYRVVLADTGDVKAPAASWHSPLRP